MSEAACKVHSLWCLRTIHTQRLLHQQPPLQVPQCPGFNPIKVTPHMNLLDQCTLLPRSNHSMRQTCHVGLPYSPTLMASKTWDPQQCVRQVLGRGASTEIRKPTSISKAKGMSITPVRMRSMNRNPNIHTIALPATLPIVTHTATTLALI